MFDVSLSDLTGMLFDTAAFMILIFESSSSISKKFTSLNSKLALKLNRSSHPEVFLEKGVLRICENLQEKTHAKVDLNKVAKQLF